MLVADNSRAAEPVDLTGKYVVTLASMTNSSWLALKTVPVGHQVFRKVPFEIGGIVHLWGYGRNTNQTSSYPEKVSDIAVNRTFATLYVLHGVYYETSDDTPAVRVAFRYTDGSAATNVLRCGADMISWPISKQEAPLKSPYSTNSEIAWMGGVFSKADDNRLRYCMTALANPHPDRLVATVDLISCKTRTIPYIFALTTGQASLMQTGPLGKLKH